MTLITDCPAPREPATLTMRAVGRTLLAPLRAWHRRRRVVRLLDFDDHMLNDIGVTREEVEWAAGLPYMRNAALDLHRVSSERRRRERTGRR